MKTNSDKKSYTVKEAFIKLLQYCAYRDRSHKEVEEKLMELRMIPEAREQIILQLMQENFINEERFARNFVRGKYRIKKWGRLKIIQELKMKDISSPLIKIALTEIDESGYYKNLQDLAAKKDMLIKEQDPFKKNNKLMNYLLQKGYESQLVYEVCKEIRH